MIKKTINPGAASDNTLELTEDLTDAPVVVRTQTVTVATLTALRFYDAKGVEQNIAVSPAQNTVPTISAKIQEILETHGYVFQKEWMETDFGLTVVPADTDFLITFKGQQNIISVSTVAVA